MVVVECEDAGPYGCDARPNRRLGVIPSIVIDKCLQLEQHIRKSAQVECSASGLVTVAMVLHQERTIKDTVHIDIRAAVVETETNKSTSHMAKRDRADRRDSEDAMDGFLDVVQHDVLLDGDGLKVHLTLYFCQVQNTGDKYTEYDYFVSMSRSVGKGPQRRMSVRYNGLLVAARTGTQLFPYAVLLIHTDKSVATWITEKIQDLTSTIIALELDNSLHHRIRALKLNTAREKMHKLRMIRPGDPHKVLVWARWARTAQTACIPKSVTDAGFDAKIIETEVKVIGDPKVAS